MELLKKEKEITQLMFFTNSEIIAKKLISLGHLPIKEELAFQGLSAGIIAECQYHTIPDVICLFLPIYEDLFNAINIDARNSILVFGLYQKFV